MIAREWLGQVRTEQLEAYVDYVQATGVDEYLRTPATARRTSSPVTFGDGLSELVALSVWDSYDDIRRFAGNDVDQMVLYRPRGAVSHRASCRDHERRGPLTDDGEEW